MRPYIQALTLQSLVVFIIGSLPSLAVLIICSLSSTRIAEMLAHL